MCGVGWYEGISFLFYVFICVLSVFVILENCVICFVVWFFIDECRVGGGGYLGGVDF